jgi:pimeloyl-ACP methyl ester carboxylesterase
MIEINQHQIHVELFGPESGQSVVLLHHGLGATNSWRNQISKLVNHGFRVIVFDRWGYGQSSSRIEFDIPWFTSDQDDLKSLLSMLGINRANLIGHSDGGTIALLFAITYPRCVNSLILSGAHIFIDNQMCSGIKEIHKRYYEDQSFRQKLAKDHASKDFQVFDNWYQGWVNPDNVKWNLRPLLHQVNCPTLIIQGENDEFATRQQAIDFANGIKHDTPRKSVYF